MKLDILIVDDSGIMRKMIMRTISMSGIEAGRILEAENGEAGIECLQQNKVDLIFSDINMPVMDGFDMIREINVDDTLRGTPIIVISTEGSETKIRKLKEIEDVKGFIRKPFEPSEVKEVILSAIGEKTCPAQNG